MSFNFSDRVNNVTKRILMIVKHNDESHALSFFFYENTNAPTEPGHTFE